MQSFSELCRMCQDWRTRNRNYGMQASQFVRNFATEIAKHIGAPETFTLPGQNEKIRYVRPLTVVAETSTFDELRGADLLEWDDNDGVWEGGVGIHLEPAPNAYPKTEFRTRLRFKLHDGTIELQIPPAGEFQIKIDDRSSWQPALQHTINKLAELLNLKPWELREPKQQIGFVWHDSGEPA